MASIDEAISSKDPKLIKKRRANFQGMMTTVHKSLGRLLVKTASKFDHDKIQRIPVLEQNAKLKKLQESFELLHQAYQEFRDPGKDEAGEEALVEEQDHHYFEVTDKIFESLQLVADYEESFQIYKAAKPDPDLVKREAEEKYAKEALAKQLKDEENLQKQEAEAATKTEEERIKKELRANVVKKERQYSEAVGKYRTAKKYAEDMTIFARGLTKEQVVSQVMEFAHVRSLPTYDTRNMLLDRLKLASDAAEAFADAVEAESGADDIKNQVKFDGVTEDASVQDLVSILNLLLNAKVEYNGKGSGYSQPAATRASPIKVKLNTPKFSGKSRDFAIFKKEFMDVIVPGRSGPEIGALLRDGLNTKEKNLLRNNEMADYSEALDILQDEYGKPDLVINDVNEDLDKLKPPTGEKADQGFIAFVEKVENICRDMETISCSGDLKNGHMINVLVKKLPAKVSYDWGEHMIKEKVGTMASEDKFRELMEFLKEKKEVTKWVISKQQGMSSDKSKTHSSYVTGQTFAIQQQRDPPKYPRNGGSRFGKSEPLCLACKGTKNPQDARHWTTDCEKWKALKLPERKRLVSCQRHLQALGRHDDGKCQALYMSKWYNNGVWGSECGICKSKNHCAELCEQNKSITKLHKVTTMTASSTASQLCVISSGC